MQRKYVHTKMYEKGKTMSLLSSEAVTPASEMDKTLR